MGAGCSMLKLVATCEWFWTNSSWRAPCISVRPTVVGLSFHCSSRQKLLFGWNVGYPLPALFYLRW
jgi:hypothetical protein